jgi:23S rRNA (uracil-5-)-methyltransferase RumA
MTLKNKIITVNSEKIVYPGRTLARCEDGLALFCDGLLPHERAEVFVTKDKASFREGVLEKILEPAPERIEPACANFGKCGGCAFEFAGYETQIKIKEDCVRELLARIDTQILAISPAPDAWHYRNKMEFSFFNAPQGPDIGLHYKGSFNKYSAVEDCLICEKVFSEILKKTRNFIREKNLTVYNNKTHEGFLRHLVLRRGRNTGQTLINIVTAPDGNAEDIMAEFSQFLHIENGSIFWTQNGKTSDAVNVDSIMRFMGGDYIAEKLTIGGKTFTFKISPFSFFQTNTAATEILYNRIIEILAPSSDDIVLDMFCGTGTISIIAASKAKQVLGIEINSQAVSDARENADFNGVKNVDFICLSASGWVREAADFHKFSKIIVDPPRAGLTKDVIDFILKMMPEKLLYVSCNPSTLARDLADLTAQGAYKVDSVLPLDMFPQTFHIECIAVLSAVKI